MLKEHPGPISVKEISDITKFTVDDITNTLKHLGMIQFYKGQHVICALPDVIDKCGFNALGLGALEAPGHEAWASRPMRLGCCHDESIKALGPALALRSGEVLAALRTQP